MSEVRVVDLKELGVSKEVFDKIYSMGEQDGRADREKEVLNYLVNNGYIRYGFDSEYLAEQLKKEQNNDNTN